MEPALKGKFLRGFTLIELLIVITILGILAAAVLVAINPGKRSSQARDAIRKSDMAAIVTALETYYVTTGEYPVDAGSLPLGTWASSLIGTWGPGKVLIDSGELKAFPQGPNFNESDYHNRYNYGDQIWYPGCWPGPGKEIVIWAWLEDPTDPDVSHRDNTNWCNDGPTAITEIDGDGKERGLYMFVSGKRIP